MENITCTCGATNLKNIIELENYKIYKCGTCKVYFSYPFADYNQLIKIYQEYKYLNYYKKWGDTDKSNIENVVTELKKYKDDGRLLDIGSGIGNFIKALKKLTTFNITALELNNEGLKELKKINNNIVASTWDEVSFKSESFDVVSMIHTLEHMQNPVSALKKAHTVLRKNGYLVIQLPALRNLNTLVSLIKKGKKGLERWCNPKGHIYLFTPTSIKHLLELSGFQIKWIITGRYRFRYDYMANSFNPFFKFSWILFLNFIDLFANIFGVGGITLIAIKK